MWRRRRERRKQRRRRSEWKGDRNSGGSTHEAWSGPAGKARNPPFEMGRLTVSGCVEEHVSYQRCL